MVQVQVYDWVVHKSGPVEDSVAVYLLDGQYFCTGTHISDLYIFMHSKYVNVCNAVSRVNCLIYLYKYEGAGGCLWDDI